MSLVVFSNSEYFFLWPIIEECVSKIQLHKIFVCDTNELNKPNGFDQYIYYDKNHCYAKRWTNDIVPKISSDYILVVHDVQVIVNCEEDFISKIIQTMDKYSLDRCSLNVFNGKEIIEQDNITLCNLNTAVGNTFTPYDLCPAIWKVNSLKILFENFPEETYRTSELNQNLQLFCKIQLKCVGLQNTNTNKIYYCIGRPYLNCFKILFITIQKEIMNPVEVYMDMKEEFLYYKNKFNLEKYVKTNNNYTFIINDFKQI